MDPATLIGIVVAFGLVIGSIMVSGDLMIFIDIPSMLIVGGGTIGAVLIQYPMANVTSVAKVIKHAFMTTPRDPNQVIQTILEFGNKARKEGILSLEPLLANVEDPYLRKGLQLTVDGMEPQAIQEVMETEISALEDRHASGVELMGAFAGFAPALGMIGTVIGLVLMLQNMNDPSAIGPAMAVALITTFYGAILANLFFIPVQGKLKGRSKYEILIKEMQLMGILSISRGENPRITAEKLSAYLPTKRRALTT